MGEAKVGQNSFGEWFVRNTGTSYSEEGGPTVTAKVSYGKGRDRYSSSREEAASDMRIATDIYIHGENSMYQMYDTPEDAGWAVVGIGTGLLMLNPSIAVNTGSNVSKVLSRAERLDLLKERLIKAPMPKNPKEALKLINKTLNKIEKLLMLDTTTEC